MSVYRFRIAGMDCADEVRMVERELAPLLGTLLSGPSGEGVLRFNVLARTLTVTLPDAPDAAHPPVAPGDIARAIARTGLEAEQMPDLFGDPSAAVPPACPTSGCSCCGGQSAPSRDGKRRFAFLREILCAGSGLLLVAGFSLRAAALPGGDACLLLAALLGMYFVLPRAWYALRRFAPDMNVLMITAVCGAIALGDLPEAAMVAFLFALSSLLESWSAGKARRAVEKLLDISPRVALVLADGEGGEPAPTPVDDVAVGARLLVRPGDSVPLDGEVLAGRSFVNQAPITGESAAVAKEEGAPLFAGSINGDGALIMRATRSAGNSTLARIRRMVEEAQGRKARSLQWVEKFAAVYTPIMMAAALALALIPPLFVGGWQHWIYQALVLLVIACPCALVISTPVCITASLATAARHGVLIKGGIHLEMPAHLDAVALDKTGTLTTGVFTVRRVLPLAEPDADRVLALAGALEAFSSHPVALAIRAEAKLRAPRDAESPMVEDALAAPGRGASGTIRIGADASRHSIGNLRFLEESLGRDAARAAVNELAARPDAASSFELETAVFLWREGDEAAVLGAVIAEDTPKPEAARAVAELKNLGVREIVMLTGDGPIPAQSVAASVGATRVFASLLPEDKAAAVAELVAQGKVVAMLGDGINDAPALASASLGVAMGAASGPAGVSGTDIAMETADIVLLGGDLDMLPWLVRLARRNLAFIRGNIAFALGTKALFAILAVFGVASLWMAVIADVGATLLVVANGMRLLRAPTGGAGTNDRAARAEFAASIG